MLLNLKSIDGLGVFFLFFMFFLYFDRRRRVLKGSADALLRADLKSKVAQGTKKAGEFQIRKRGTHMLTQTIVGAKKGKGSQHQACFNHLWVDENKV